MSAIYLIEKCDASMVVIGTYLAKWLPLSLLMHKYHTSRQWISITATKATRVIQQFGNENIS